MIHLNIKPLSVNCAFKGKRFKTKEYSQYEKAVLLMLPSPLYLEIEYGFSNSSADIDNPNKLILDILVKKYNFNDRDIYAIDLRKKIVKKGKEYIKIKTYER